MNDATDEASSGGWLSRLRAGLSRTSQRLTDGITDALTKRRLDAETIQKLEEALISADIGVATAAKLTAKLAEDRFDKEISNEEVRTALADDIAEILRPVAVPLAIDPARKPHVILVAGVNGSGKTTTIGKLARMLRDEGKSVMLAAGDTFRAAAVEQLTMWSERLGCEIVKQASGADPASVAHIGCERALETNSDYLIVDTAGRLQTQKNLMDELAKVHRVISKKIPGAPHESLLVLDATTGQNGVSQARNFSEVTECTGIILAKLDGTAKGGVVVPIRQQMGIPVKYVGVGEQIDDLEPFDPDNFVDALIAD